MQSLNKQQDTLNKSTIYKEIAPTVPQTEPNIYHEGLQKKTLIQNQINTSFQNNMKFHHFEYIEEYRKSLDEDLSRNNKITEIYNPIKIINYECIQENQRNSINDYIMQSQLLTHEQQIEFKILCRKNHQIQQIIKMSIETYNDDYLYQFIYMVAVICESYNNLKNKSILNKTFLPSAKKLLDLTTFQSILSSQSLYHAQQTKSDIIQLAAKQYPNILQLLNKKIEILNYKKQTHQKQSNEFKIYIKNISRIIYLVLQGYCDCMQQMDERIITTKIDFDEDWDQFDEQITGAKKIKL